MYEGDNGGYESPQSSTESSTVSVSDSAENITVQSEGSFENVSVQPEATKEGISVDLLGSDEKTSFVPDGNIGDTKLDENKDNDEKPDDVVVEDVKPKEITVQIEKHNGYTYEKSSDGTLKITGEIQHEKAERGKYDPAPEGMENGHVIASTENGTKDQINIVDQAKDINRSEMRKVENAEKRAVDKGYKVETERYVTPATNGVPASFIINDRITDDKGRVNEVHFSFTNANHSEIEEWEKTAAETGDENEKSSYQNVVDSGLTGVTEEEYNALLEETEDLGATIKEEFEGGFKTIDKESGDKVSADIDNFEKNDTVKSAEKNEKSETPTTDEKAVEELSIDLEIDFDTEQKEISDIEAKNSFNAYRTAVTTEDITVYRTYGGHSEADGRYWTTEMPTDRMVSKTDSALAPQWGNDRSYYCKAVIPKGTEIQIGKAASQKTLEGHELPGGATQIYLENGIGSGIVEKDIELGFNTNYSTFDKKADAIEEESKKS